MNNTAAFSARDVQAIFGDNAIVPDYFAANGVSTDSRTMRPGNIFVALRGQNFDAHNNIHEAIIKGAACVVMQRDWLAEWNSGPGAEFPKFSRIVVDDTLIALADLARWHRRRFNIPVVAIAGANGKTTTKDMAAHCLAAKFHTLATAENFNNRIGAAHTLLQLNKTHQAAVVEIGTNEPGEIEILSAMVEPTHGLITNIAEEHLEKLIDLDGVEKEETSLFRYCSKASAQVLLNMDDERLAEWTSHLHAALSFGTVSDDSDSYALSASFSFDDQLHPTLELAYLNQHAVCSMQCVGYAAALNALAAIAVGLGVGMTLDECAEAMCSYQSREAHGYARMVVQAGPNCVVLNDCYNANPASMRMALLTLRDYPTASRHIALLGDMRELGAATAIEHDRTLGFAQQCADLILVLGNEMNAAVTRAGSPKEIVCCSSHADAVEKLKQHVQGGDVVLVKASRGIALDKVIDAFLG